MLKRSAKFQLAIGRDPGVGITIIAYLQIVQDENVNVATRACPVEIIFGPKKMSFRYCLSHFAILPWLIFAFYNLDCN